MHLTFIEELENLTLEINALPSDFKLGVSHALWKQAWIGRLFCSEMVKADDYGIIFKEFVY